MAGLGPDQVRVIVRGAGKNGQPLRYIRHFVGMTVAKAIEILDFGGQKEGRVPHLTTSPYYLNRKEVDEYSDMLLKGGDVLSCNDP